MLVSETQMLQVALRLLILQPIWRRQTLQMEKSELTPADPTRSSPVRGTFGHVNTAVCESVRVSCGKVESEIPGVNNSPVPLVKSLVAAPAIQDEPSVAPEGDREVNSGEPSHQQNLQESRGEGTKNALGDLVQGELSQEAWQYTSYHKECASWLAAAQRRHMHRRRGNQLSSVVAIDLSGPHEPTPMIGQSIGKRPGRYFLVLTVHPGGEHGFREAAV